MADLIKQLTDALAAAHAGAVAEPPPLPKWANVEAATIPQVQDIVAATLVTDSEAETADIATQRLAVFGMSSVKSIAVATQADIDKVTCAYVGLDESPLPVTLLIRRIFHAAQMQWHQTQEGAAADHMMGQANHNRKEAGEDLQPQPAPQWPPELLENLRACNSPSEQRNGGGMTHMSERTTRTAMMKCSTSWGPSKSQD